eukprot:1764990-Prymnesium_polylepis.2
MASPTDADATVPTKEEIEESLTSRGAFADGTRRMLTEAGAARRTRRRTTARRRPSTTCVAEGTGARRRLPGGARRRQHVRLGAPCVAGKRPDHPGRHGGQCEQEMLAIAMPVGALFDAALHVLSSGFKCGLD